MLKQLRKNSGLTQAQLAEKIHITQGYIAQIESGKADPKLSVVNRILDALSGKEQSVTAKDIMTSELVTGSPTQVTEELTGQMLKAGFSQIPIVNKQGHCIGTMIESDLLVKLMKEGPTIRWSPVKDVMSSPLPTFHEDTPVDIIEQILERIPAVLITDNRGKVTGIITRSDVLEQF
ncbi:MAG: CBS domain-containing protein [Candidatus Odinarchaeota archaeon]